ncbi:hypothetical protein [Paraburkholderia humisilvae]
MAIMETGMTILKQHDLFIQRGTRHGWKNATEEPCSMLFFS